VSPMHRFAVALLLVVAPVAHAQSTVSRVEKNTTIRITYGKVVALEAAKIESGAGSGAALGALIGAATTDKKASGGQKLGNAAIGAGVGAGLVHLLEGSHKAVAITVMRKDGTALKVIQSKADGLAVGDCVAVEEGVKSSIARVSRTFCGEVDPPAAPKADSSKVAAVRDSAAVDSTAKAAPTPCDLAKQLLLAAKTKEEVELALAKVKALCE